ncbi:AAA family ATPase [Candidatus Saganbacteria bacterium CG08_land_8_20_14_0_20_45_16]|uniref:AAA family ATPase n=1 Tax=Candidatus Saganbacteria bacterium CG08_land_8_20_14_0_20_45_16 TaxID=2014293 RepID=A0A2H0Y1F1_UNCSA|nr:MAG: AAA family ATPase [Candidatus Saganbacteria bacterium CG08_land_8_20_14_0_20_45_16]
MAIEFNNLFIKALDLLENTSQNVFITGKAGTGKSTLLDYFRNQTKKRVVVLAPTGVAAINVRGETIHSFFGFKPDITLDKVRQLDFKKRQKENIYKKIDAIVIDEISMVRADLLDCVDKFLRLNGPAKNLPFGGLQMIFFGDLYQLPPVVTSHERHIFQNHYSSPYFFSARVFQNIKIEYLELEKVYRQKDEQFIGLLNTIRNNSATEPELAVLNQRYLPDFEAKDDFAIYLTTTNLMASELNEKRLEELKGKLRVLEGELLGDFEQNQLPTGINLKLKIGAQVMMLNNDPLRRWVNGTMGKIKKIKQDEIEVELQDGKREIVQPFTWEIFHFSFDPKIGQLDSEVVATFTQFPLKLAWAITIHKSQGKTFDKVIIDIGRGTFAHGQMYVALSRCRSLDGIVLKKLLKKSHIFMDWRVVKFVTSFQYQKSEDNCSLAEKIRLINEVAAKGGKVKITYLKASDEKSKRVIEPLEIAEMEYKGKLFLGLRAFCHNRGAERTFRIDRILEFNEV